MNTYPYAIKIRIIAQFSLDILQIQYHWKLLLQYLGVPDHTHKNGPSHVDVIMYDGAKCILCI